uniref:Serine protease n=1 Tax=Solemoviridae sp. TaxID=2715208 RepID=A0A8K1J704_9VIRU|nr:MAG: hypothetical protein [Solemoviridae sp.]
MTPPSSQCGIMIKNNQGEFVVHGCAVRFPNNWLVAPDHVLSDGRSGKYAKGRQGYLDLAGKERISLAADMVGIKLTEADFAKIGISAAKVGLIAARKILATIATYKGKGTCAALQNDYSIFGTVRYDGTTMPGYSGAAYMNGSALLGIHQHGGKENGGYNASFIYAVLNRLDKIRNEDTPEWLEKLARSNNPIPYRDFDMDSIMILHDDGRFAIVDKSDVKAHFDNWDGGNLRRSKKGLVAYDDAELESASGEASNLSTSGASGSSVKPSDLDINQLPQLIGGLTRALKAANKQNRKSIVITPTPSNTTLGPIVATGQPAT